VEGLVRLVEGRPAVEAVCGSVTALNLAQAAWQCLLALVDLAAAGSASWQHVCSAVKALLCSVPACQVLLQQPGGVCSMEEVCGVLVRCFPSDEDVDTIEAAAGLLGNFDRLKAALAVPGFAAAVLTHAVGPAARKARWGWFDWHARGRLLEVLVSHVSGRAALVAEAGTLGHLAWKISTDEKCARVCSSHMAALWGAGAEEGLAEALVAGLAAGKEGWVRFFGWLVKGRPFGEWSQVDGLPTALIAAFDSHQLPVYTAPVGPVSQWRTPKRDITPLEQVLMWLLEGEGGRQLLWDHDEVEEAVSRWLQRHASAQHWCPLVPLLQSDTSDAAGGRSCLATSPVLAKGALLSLVTCRNDSSTYTDRRKVGSLVAGWVVEHEEVQQLVLEDRGLLCALLRAMATGLSTAGEQQQDDPNTFSASVLAQLPEEELLPQLVELLTGMEDSHGCSLSAAAAGEGAVGPSSALPDLASVLSAAEDSSSSATTAPAAAAAGSPDALLVAGAWLAMEQFRRCTVEGEQQVLAAMRQLACDAARVRELQQVEAAGHVACVAAAQARQQLVAQQQQLQRERVALAEQQLQLQQEREALAAQQQRIDAATADTEQQLQRGKEAVAAQQQQLQRERQALQAELQQLQRLQRDADQQRKRQKV
jgi:hypothetical protein